MILYSIQNQFIYFSYPEDVEKGYMTDTTIPEARHLMKLFGIAEYEENKYEISSLTEREIIILSGILAMFFKPSKKLEEIILKATSYGA